MTAYTRFQELIDELDSVIKVGLIPEDCIELELSIRSWQPIIDSTKAKIAADAKDPAKWKYPNLTDPDDPNFWRKA